MRSLLFVTLSMFAFTNAACQATLSKPYQQDEVDPADAGNNNGNFCESAGLVVMEAENAAVHNGFAEVSHNDASGGRAMQVGDDGSLDFEVFLTTPGTYHFWVRTLAPDSDNNGIFVKLDGELITAGGDNPYMGVPDIYLRKSPTEWFWEPAWQGPGEGEVQGPITFIAGPGQHTLSILKRKIERPLIDKVVLTVANTAPSDFGPAETPCN